VFGYSVVEGGAKDSRVIVANMETVRSDLASRALSIEGWTPECLSVVNSCQAQWLLVNSRFALERGGGFLSIHC